MNRPLRLPDLSTAFVAASLLAITSPIIAATRITVSAGEWDRSQSVVTFTPPRGIQGSAQLRDERGGFLPVQVDSTGQASFILPKLAQGQTASLELVGTDAKPPPLVEVTREGRKLKVASAKKPVLEYQAEAGELPRPEIKPNLQRGGYIHPVFSPSGLAVTDDYPSNHLHHHGIWFPWTKTEFEGRTPDFWNMGDGKGRVEFVALDRFWSGPVQGGFIAQHRFVDLLAPQPKVALNERWEVRIYAVNAAPKPYQMFDLISTQECASTSPLKLPKYYYGGLGFRGSWDWNGKEQQPYLTSEGIADKIKGNETRGRWCHIGGTVKGQRTGIAILSHPDNFRAPQPMRLHPSEPFFCFAPSQLDDFQIEPGKPYVSRYRFIVMDGPPDAAEIDRLWNDYAHPPEVKVSL